MIEGAVAENAVKPLYVSAVAGEILAFAVLHEPRGIPFISQYGLTGLKKNPQGRPALGIAP
jgi:hypothetical protein